MNVFNCNKCSKCCENVGFNKELPSTNGVCDYLVDGLCSIYEKRPVFCRVDDFYENYRSSMTLDEYYKANEAVCRKLQGEPC